MRTGTIQQFNVPRLFKVALLHRREAVDKTRFNFSLFKDVLELGRFYREPNQHAPALTVRRGTNIRPFDIQMRQGMRQVPRFRQGGLLQTRRSLSDLMSG